MFERTLEDLVRGLRANKKNESVFIGQVLNEIRDELKSVEFSKKAVAVSKLTYLQMIGVDISWASFNVIEVMSQTKFSFKRIGYLAACQSFHEGTEVITLATNLIRKDMISHTDVWAAGIAINCLANICTPDLARDLAADIVTLLSSSRPYIRKKATLVLFKIFLKFPDALRPAFPRLKEKLEDQDQAVVAAAVNVVCELARKNPKNYISLAPMLFTILTANDRVTNNWVLIKIVKLFAALLPIEQRLAKKLVQPLTNIMNTTTAMSLQYECIQTCTVGLSDHLPTIKLCISKLRNFVEDSDQNLKYLGLLALNNIMKIHPKAVAEHRDLVLNCLEDEDTSIRLRALDLLEGMVSKRNIGDITRKLLENIEKAESGSYKEAIIEKVIIICSKNNYQSINDFEWYISVLMELTHISGTKHGSLISAQFMDVCIRVNVVRPFAVKNMLSLLRDSQILGENPREGGNTEVLYAAAWVVGEFSSMVDDKLGAIEALLQPRIIHLLPQIQSIYMQSILKIFGAAASTGAPKGSVDLLDPMAQPAPVQRTYQTQKLDEITKIMSARLPLFTQSQYLEVQERACFVSEVLSLYIELGNTSIGLDLVSVFEEPLNPVAPKAQRKVPIPDGLDLDRWINDEPVDTFEETGDGFGLEEIVRDSGSKNQSSFSFIDSASEQSEPERGKEIRSSRNRQSDPFYLPNKATQKKTLSEDDIPQTRITPGDLGFSSDKPSYKNKLQEKEASRSSRSRKQQPIAIITADEDLSGDELAAPAAEDELDAVHKVDLRAPLGREEVLPVASHRVARLPEKKPEESKERRSKSGKSSRSGESSKPHRSRSGKSSSSKDREKDREKDRDVRKSSSSTKAADSNLINFDPVPITGSNYAPLSSPQVLDEKHASRKHSSRKDKDGKEHRSEHRSRSGSKSKDEKRGRDERRSSRSSGSKPKESPTSPAQTRQTAKFRPLCQDENISIIYELKVSPKDGKKLLVAFVIKNLSQKELSNITFNIPASLNMKVTSESSTTVSTNLNAGDTTNFNLIFDCQNFQQSQKLPGSVSYKAGETQGKRDFNLLVPSSASVLPVKIEEELFFSFVREPNLASSGADVRPDTEDFQAFIVSLAMLLHVELITQKPGVSLYGRSVQGHQVAVYLKQKEGGVVSVQLRCTDDAFGKSLISEVSGFFPRA